MAADETADTPEMTPEEQAANQAHTDVNEAEKGWAGQVEDRLAALEAHAGIGQDDETADEAEEETKA